MGFRSNSTYLSEYSGLGIYDSDGASENILGDPSLDSVGYLENPFLDGNLTTYTIQATAGSFMGGRLGIPNDNNNKWKRNDYQSLGTSSSVQFDNHVTSNTLTRHIHEEMYGHLHGKPLAIGNGVIAAWRNVSARPTSSGEIRGSEKYGVDLFRYDGSFIKTIDPYDIKACVSRFNLTAYPEHEAFHFGTSISIGEGRILITNPYHEMKHGGNAYYSQGAAWLFDLDGNQLSKRWDAEGGTGNSQLDTNTEDYNELKHFVTTDLITRQFRPLNFSITPVRTGFGMCSAIGEGRIVITAPFDVKKDTLVQPIPGESQAFYFTGNPVGRGCFHIYDTNMNHIKRVDNPDFADYLFLENTVGTKNWDEITNNCEGFGRSIAIGDGRIIVGAPNYKHEVDGQTTKGKIYCFDLDGNLLWSKGNPDSFSYGGGRYDSTGCFGNAVAIDSGMIAVGNHLGSIKITGSGISETSTTPGVVHVFDLDGNELWEKRGGASGYNYEGVGYSVGISDNVVYYTYKQAQTSNQNTGYLFAVNADASELALKSTFVENDFFGECVAAADGYVVVSEPGATVNGYPYAGRLRLYKNSVQQPFKSASSWRNYDQKLGGAPAAANIGWENNRDYKEIKASDYIGEGGTLTINFVSDIGSDFIWSDDVNVPALLVDVKNATIVNNGRIIGKGGSGGGSTGGDGGPAIKITASGVTIQNNSGAYIAGGGGGGGGTYRTSTNNVWMGGGGGGAGGGAGGLTYRSNDTYYWEIDSGVALGGAVEAAGADASNILRQRRKSDNADFGTTTGADAGDGGGAGGGGGTGDINNYSGGGGGGRQLPGTGGAGSTGGGGAGGAAGAAGSAGETQTSNFNGAAGGGGGWGAAGGDGGTAGFTGGAGGAAIFPQFEVSYTLINNGTIYGSTS